MTYYNVLNKIIEKQFLIDEDDKFKHVTIMSLKKRIMKQYFFLNYLKL